MKSLYSLIVLSVLICSCQNEIKVVEQTEKQKIIIETPESNSKTEEEIKNPLFYYLDSLLKTRNKITKLHLSSYDTTSSLPSIIGDFSQLTELSIEGMPISKLPSSFSKLKRLKYLDARKTKFNYFPTELYELDSLKLVFFHYSNIDSIPDGISQMKSLSNLFLGWNPPLRYVANDFEELANLSRFGFCSSTMDSVNLNKVKKNKVLSNGVSEDVFCLQKNKNF
jgi:Leucine-rich repeat (LRR) protein